MATQNSHPLTGERRFTAQRGGGSPPRGDWQQWTIAEELRRWQSMFDDALSGVEAADVDVRHSPETLLSGRGPSSG